MIHTQYGVEAELLGIDEEKGVATIQYPEDDRIEEYPLCRLRGWVKEGIDRGFIEPS